MIILGGYLGEPRGFLIPNGYLHDVFVKGFPLGFDSPIVLNLKVIILTLGFMIMINLFGVVGMIAGLYYYK